MQSLEEHRRIAMSEQVTPLTVEERLTALEAVVAQLRTRVEHMTSPDRPWWEQSLGCMKDIPAEEWEEFQRYCREFRNADRTPDDEP
jgi:hypothetical protein